MGEDTVKATPEDTRFATRCRRAFLRGFFVTGVLACLAVAIPLFKLTVETLVAYRWTYQHPEHQARILEAQKRSEDSSIRMCEQFFAMSARYPQIGPMTPKMIETCATFTPKPEQLGQVKKPVHTTHRRAI